MSIQITNFMHSFLIISKQNEILEKEIKKISDHFQIHHFDINTINIEGTIGIEIVRTLQKTIYLKPLRGLTKLILLKNAHNLTTDAQNAMLKLLEEPPDNTIIVLTATNKELLLSTIRSRCTIIETLEKSEDSPQSFDPKKTQILDLEISGVGNALRRAQDLSTNKDEVLKWLEETILTSREVLHTQINQGERENHHTITKLKLLQEAYVTTKTTNVSPRLILENLFLSL